MTITEGLLLALTVITSLMFANIIKLDEDKQRAVKRLNYYIKLNTVLADKIIQSYTSGEAVEVELSEEEQNFLKQE